MEKHKCKLCARTFANGRALGGHMKGHLANHPLLPKKTQPSVSASSSSGEEQETREVVVVEEKLQSLVYGLRENPKKSFRFADPEFSFAGDSAGTVVVVVQDRESETESRNPTRRRSKRNRKVGCGTITNTPTETEEIKKPKLLMRKPSLVVESSPTESEPVSSVSDTPPVEDVAMCLMMLSKDVWKSKQKLVDELEEESEEIELNNNSKKKNKIRGKYRCGKCKKSFRSFDTLDEHNKRVICSSCEATKNAGNKVSNDRKIFECPFCFRMFGSGQALGGHKRSHLLSAASASSAAAANSSKLENNLIDLNLPAPLEDDEFSVVSDA